MKETIRAAEVHLAQRYHSELGALHSPVMVDMGWDMASTPKWYPRAWVSASFGRLLLDLGISNVARAACDASIL